MAEVRRPNEALIKLKNEHMFYYKGHQSEKVNGVGFLVNKSIAKNVVEYNGISDRIAYLKLKLNKRYFLKVIQVYFPTTSYEDEAVERLYDQISEILRTDKTYYTVVMGDFNAKIGTKLNNSETSIGNYGYGRRNERGDMLMNFCMSENLSIMNSFFKKREARKWTWKSPDGVTRNEIDFFLCDNPKIFQDVSTINRINTGSDHRLLRSKIKIFIKIERAKLIRSRQKVLDIDNLHQKRTHFQNQLNNRFAILDTDELSVDDLTDAITENLVTTANEVGGYKVVNNRYDKISDTTKQMINRRRALNKNSNTEKIEHNSLTKEINERKRKEIRANNVNLVAKAIEEGKSVKRSFMR